MSFPIGLAISLSEVQALISEFKSCDLHILESTQQAGSPYQKQTSHEYVINRSIDAFGFDKLPKESAQLNRELPGYQGEALISVQIAMPSDDSLSPKQGDPARIEFLDVEGIRRSFEGHIKFVIPYVSGIIEIYLEERALR